MASIFQQIMAGRIAKTEYLRRDRSAFLRQLIGELQREQNAADNEGTTLAVRLNMFSDIPWETGAYGMIPYEFPVARFYDYTKIAKRMRGRPANYSLTFSWSEHPEQQQQCLDALWGGHNVAVCFYEPGLFASNRALGQRLPRIWKGFQVFDGDAQDMRFLDPGPTRTGNGRVCGLRLKAATNEGREAAIKSGFAVIVD